MFTTNSDNIELIHPFEYNDSISAYHGVHGKRFNFNHHPIAPLEFKVLTCDSPDKRPRQKTKTNDQDKRPRQKTKAKDQKQEETKKTQEETKKTQKRPMRHKRDQ
jgi:hypothetical protein